MILVCSIARINVLVLVKRIIFRTYQKGKWLDNLSLFYVLSSVLIFIVQLKLIKHLPKVSHFVFLFYLFCAFTGVIHYRIFLYGTVFDIDLNNPFVVFFALAAFLLTCFVPTTQLSRKFRKNESPY